MRRRRTAPTTGECRSATGRTYLAGVGSLTVSGLGTTAGGTPTTGGFETEGPTGNENPFGDPHELEAFVDDDGD